MKDAIDFNHLFKLRLVVARHGEMDGAKWWNTQGMLGRRGEVVLKRGLPATHFFAQARVVFAVAKTRCQELFDPPGCMTLWSLPAELEEQFEEHWQDWLDRSDEWEPIFRSLHEQTGDDLLKSLRAAGLVEENHLDAVRRMRRSAENRAVPIGGSFTPNDEILTLLAAGFSRGEPGSPAIPYARLEG